MSTQIISLSHTPYSPNREQMRDFIRDHLRATRDRFTKTSPSPAAMSSSFHVHPPRGYPAGVPSKFDPDGNVQHFPGNTIVSHLSPSSALYASLLGLHAKLAASPLAHLFTLLPPSSWHMTVFEGVCDTERYPGHWPSDLPRDLPLDECTAHLAGKLSTFDLGEDARPPYRLTAQGFTSFDVGIGVHLSLRTPEEETRFRELRDRLSEVLKIRHAQHDRYGLHLSMAYFLRHLDEAQKEELGKLLMGHFESMPREFELGAPEFCTFENMFRFDRLFYLENRG